MAKKKEEQELKSTFTKEQFKNSDRYHYQQDLIEVLLDPYLKYTVEEVDNMIKIYIESEAK